MNPEQESGTPRTNSKMFTLSIHMGEEFEGYKVVPWAVARDLERELEAANARAARMEEALKLTAAYLEPRIVGSNGYGDTVVLPQIRAALTSSPNAWLLERLGAERERAARHIERLMPGDQGEGYAASIAAQCAAAIRALP